MLMKILGGGHGGFGRGGLGHNFFENFHTENRGR